MADSRTCHVSLTGSDQSTGTEAEPFRTVSRALTGAEPGTRIVIEPGIHHERIQIPASGEPGSPIVLEGVRGPNDEWQTVIDGAAPVACRWEPAPEVGTGVYKTTEIAFEPHFLTVEGKQIPRIWPDRMEEGTGFEKLAFPASKSVKMTYLDVEVNYWDIVEAMYGCRDGTTYIRFRDGDDPNDKVFRGAPAGAVVEIENQSHVVFRNLLVRDGQNCFLIKGREANHNLVENCRLINGAQRVLITDGASNNIIRSNEVTAEFYGERYQTGAWGMADGEPVPYELGVKEHFYHEYKHLFAPHATSDHGVRVHAAGEGNEICGNHIALGGQGIGIGETSRVLVCGNKVHNFSSIGIRCTLNKVAEVRIYDNVVYDCNINLRIHHVNEPNQAADRSLYVYRNRFHQNPGTGTHIFMHYHNAPEPEGYRHANVFIYHNSLSGGHRGISMNAHAGNCGGLPGGIIVNNVLSARAGFSASDNFIAQEGMFGLFDYNWLGAETGHDCVRAPWYGAHNIHEPGRAIWDGAEMPDFVLPEGSAALNAGLDLSKPFSANGKQVDPLPGMEPGYFAGPRPDLGAGQLNP